MTLGALPLLMALPSGQGTLLRRDDKGFLVSSGVSIQGLISGKHSFIHPFTHKSFVTTSYVPRDSSQHKWPWYRTK